MFLMGPKDRFSLGVSSSIRASGTELIFEV